MFAATSLIPELEHVLQHGTREKRADALKRITSLFVDGEPLAGTPCQDRLTRLYRFLKMK